MCLFTQLRRFKVNEAIINFMNGLFGIDNDIEDFEELKGTGVSSILFAKKVKGDLRLKIIKLSSEREQLHYMEQKTLHLLY